MKLLDVTEIPLQPRAAGCLVPLTAMQRRAWNVLVDGMSEMRTGECSARILGSLDAALLRTSIEIVMRRHESLRTRIVVVEGVPRQQVDAPRGCDLEVIELSGGSRTKGDGEAKRLAEEFIYEKIDLTAGPLFAAKLLRLSKYEHVLMLGIDHIVTDGASGGILWKEIWTVYKQAAQGLSIRLPNVPVQFSDYAVWQQRTYEAWRKKHEPYWRERLTGAPNMELPFDSSLSGVTNLMWTMAELPLGDTASARLRAIAWRERTLLPLVVLTIVIAAMSRWCSQRDFVVMFASHGRHARPQLANTIGYLATALHLRIEIAEGDSFLDLLRRVTLEFSTAQEHQDFDRVPDLIPECTSSVRFNWSSTNWTRRFVLPQAEAVGQLGIQWTPIRKPRGILPTAWRGLRFAVFPGDDIGAGIVLRVQYQTSLFASSTIERLSRNLRLFAEEIIEDPLTSVASLRFAL